MLKQDQYSPLPVAKQILIIYAGTRGWVDSYPVEVLGKYEAALYQLVETKHQSLMDEIAQKKVLSEELSKKIDAVLEELKGLFDPNA